MTTCRKIKFIKAQFVTPAQRQNFVAPQKNLDLLSKIPQKPQKSLMEIKRDLVQKVLFA